MKKIIVLFSFLAVLCSSCIWQRGDRDVRPTQRGMEIYDTWRQLTSYVMNEPAKMAFCLNAWISADSLGRIEIEDSYMPNQRIRIDSLGNYLIYNGSQLLYSVNTHQTALSDDGASWSIQLLNEWGPYGWNVDMPSEIEISQQGAGCWNITPAIVVDSTSAWNLRVTAATTPVYLKTEEYQIDGSGTWTIHGYEDESDCVLMNYNITTPIKHVDDAWSQGKISLVASYDSEEIPVEAEILNVQQVRISYSGITETWGASYE